MKPDKLHQNDMVGIIAPSHFIDRQNSNVREGLECLKSSVFEVVLGENLYKQHGQSAGTIEERLSDIETMFRNINIKAIFCALGGDSANQLLANIDYNLIRNNPKIFVGFSDNTHLQLSIFHKTGLSSFYGPSLKSFSQIDKESYNFLIDMLTGKPIVYPSSFNILKAGKAEGVLIGGNLFVINSMLASPYSPDYDDKILFIEDVDEGLSSIEYQLYQLKNTGLLHKIKGLIVGHIETKTKNIYEIIQEILKGEDFPIIQVEYFGHEINNFLTIPIGINARIDTNKKEFTLLEDVVN